MSHNQSSGELRHKNTLQGAQHLFSTQPRQATSFIGRNREMAEILARLSDPTCRLLTLVGPGGIGKTRLATEAAICLADASPNAVYFVPFQPVISADWLVSALAEALHFSFETENEPEEQLLNHLAHLSTVLLFDNFEHLLDGVGLVQEIIHRAPSVKLLVTSRQRLNLQSEWVFEVGGLAYPDDEPDQPLEMYSATQLFLDRAARVYSGFSLQDEARVIAQICALLEGMPLAIELASAWVRALSCADILAELQRGLNLLEASTLDIPARHRSMRAVLDTSWDRLSNAEQAVFQRLSVFRGGITRDALQSVTEANPRLISALVDQSWLRRDARTGRYQVHELLRQYGEEKLSNSPDEAADAGNRHCRYFLDFLVRTEVTLNGPDQKPALQAIEDDLENIHVSLNWAVQHREIIAMSPSLHSLYLFYSTVSRFHEGEQLFAKLAGLLRAHASQPDEGRLLGKVLAISGSMCHNLDRHHEAKVLLEEALTIFHRLNARHDIAFCLYRIGVTLRYWEGRISEALASFQSSFNLYQELGDLSGMMKSLGWMGIVYLAQGNVIAADQATSTSMNFANLLSNPADRATAAVFRGEVMKEMGYYQEARQLFQDAYTIYEASGIQWGRIKTIREISQLSLLLDDYPQAQISLLQAFQVATQLRLKSHNLHNLLHYSILLTTRGQLEQAAEIFTLLEKEFADLHQERESVREQLSKLQAQLSPERFAAAVKVGQQLNWQITVKAVMNELSQPVSDPFLLNPLTAREHEILRLIAAGFSNREIAEQLVLTPGTVKWYVSEMFSKLNVNNRTRLVAQARQLNLFA